jgi:hypothetical protein
MSYLVPLIEDPQNFAVNSALNAVGLAALSNIRMSPQMMLKARREYTAALSHTNQALRDPIKSKQDDILAAVVLLGMFEVSLSYEHLLYLIHHSLTGLGYDMY